MSVGEEMDAALELGRVLDLARFGYWALDRSLGRSIVDEEVASRAPFELANPGPDQFAGLRDPGC